MAEKSGIKDTRILNIFVAIKNFKQLDKYVTGMVKVHKKISNNQIKKVLIGKSFTDGYTEAMVIERYNNLRKLFVTIREEEQIDIVITSNINLDLDCVKLYKDFIPANQQELINYYTDTFQVISKGSSSISPQKLSLGNGLILTETDNKTGYKIDFQNLQPVTIALMYAIEYAKKDDFSMLYKAYKEAEEY